MRSLCPLVIPHICPPGLTKGQALKYQEMIEGRSYSLADDIEYWIHKASASPDEIEIVSNGIIGSMSKNTLRDIYSDGTYRTRKVLNKTLRLHIGIYEAPEYVRDAIIVHEMGHIYWSNHTREFWNYVYRTLEKEYDDGHVVHEDTFYWLQDNGWATIPKSGKSKVIERNVLDLHWHMKFQHGDE